MDSWSHSSLFTTVKNGTLEKLQDSRNMKSILSHNNSFILLLALICIQLFSSCNSWREVVMFQDLDEVVLRNQQMESSIKIKPGDQLTIMVFGADKYLIMPYNQTLNSVSENSLGSGGDRQSQLPYDVDKDGYIMFPVLGRIKVAGLTTDELKVKMHEILDSQIRDMTLFVAVENFRISVLGEVNQPGSFSIKYNSCSFLEALALAGDLKLTANRRKVALLRMEEGQMKHYYYDLTQSDLLDSEHLYLQQNDVIYVPPTKSRSEEARTNNSSRSWWVAASSVLISMVTLLVNL